jgi:hypothetical protein
MQCSEKTGSGAGQHRSKRLRAHRSQEVESGRTGCAQLASGPSISKRLLNSGASLAAVRAIARLHGGYCIDRQELFPEEGVRR